MSARNPLRPLLKILLRGFTWPADKKELLEQARRSGNDAALAHLQRLPDGDRRYTNSEQVSQAVREQ